VISIFQRWIGVDMNINFVFLRGVMWCRFGQRDAGKELLMASDSRDPDVRSLAWAMLAKGVRRLRGLDAQTSSGTIPG
jgi:hypothetical protein